MWNRAIGAFWAAYFVLAASSLTRGELIHLGDSPAQRTVACAERLLDKRVLWEFSAPVGKVLEAGCPESRAELLRVLKAHSISVVEEEKWALLLPSSRLPPWPPPYPEGFRVHWKHFRVEISAVAGDPQQNQATLSHDQLEQLKAQVLAQTRLIPIPQPYTETADEAAVIPLRLEVYVRRMRSGGSRSVVVVLRQNDNDVPGRLIYGEETEPGNFRLVWDSPIILVRYIVLGFDDVDGDGIEEIVFNSAFPAGMHDLDAMTVFNAAGTERTRALPCTIPDLFGYSAADGTCPIVGDEVRFDYSTPAPLTILVNRLFQSNDGAEFKLKNGKYSRVTPVRAKRSR